MVPPMTAIEKLARCWRDAEHVVVLTGAGLSTASGIPDFRSPGGRWSRYRPVTIQEFLATEEARDRYWRYKGETWQVIRTAPPNPGTRRSPRSPPTAASTCWSRRTSTACTSGAGSPPSA